MGDFKVDTNIINSDTHEPIVGEVKEIFDEFGSQCYNQGYDAGLTKGVRRGLLIGASMVLAGICTYVAIVKLHTKFEEKKKKSV